MCYLKLEAARGAYFHGRGVFFWMKCFSNVLTCGLGSFTVYCLLIGFRPYGGRYNQEIPVSAHLVNTLASALTSALTI